MPPQAALPATERQASLPRDSHKNAAGAPECLTSPEELREECLKFPGGVTTCELSCDTAAGQETNIHGDLVPSLVSAGAGMSHSAELGLTGAKRPPQGPALGSFLALTHRPLAADSSNITTPTSTAPGPASISIVRAATETKGKVTSTLAKRVTARRGGTAGRTKGKAAERLTASEYAKQKNAEVEERRLSGKKTNAKQFLGGKRIFYYGNDMGFPSKDTTRRMDIVSE